MRNYSDAQPHVRAAEQKWANGICWISIWNLLLCRVNLRAVEKKQFEQDLCPLNTCFSKLALCRDVLSQTYPSNKQTREKVSQQKVFPSRTRCAKILWTSPTNLICSAAGACRMTRIHRARTFNIVIAGWWRRKKRNGKAGNEFLWETNEVTYSDWFCRSARNSSEVESEFCFNKEEFVFCSQSSIA